MSYLTFQLDLESFTYDTFGAHIKAVGECFCIDVNAKALIGDEKENGAVIGRVHFKCVLRM